jgi:hypothetical protein
MMPAARRGDLTQKPQKEDKSRRKIQWESFCGFLVCSSAVSALKRDLFSPRCF